jgi:hypothetical protein
MRSIGSFMALLGIAAVVMNFLDRVPRLLMWIYLWGDGVAWAIKIGLIVIGGALYFFGPKSEDQEEDSPASESKEE